MFFKFFKKTKDISSQEVVTRIPKELPIEAFGTEEEREQRFLMILSKIKEEAEKLGISEEIFVKKLEEAKNFVNKMVLFHSTSTESFIKIWKKRSNIYSLRKLKELGMKIKGHTYYFDRKFGLDNFVFLSMNPIRFQFGEILIGVEITILQEYFSLVSLEDILEIMRKLTGLTQWEIDFLTEDQTKEVLEEYRKQILEGKHFYQIFCALLALYFKNSPYEYYEDEELRDKIWGSLQTYLSLKGRYSGNPEIKIYPEVPLSKIKGIVVFSPQVKELLIQIGFPSDKIKVVPKKESKAIFEAFKELG